MILFKETKGRNYGGSKTKMQPYEQTTIRHIRDPGTENKN